MDNSDLELNVNSYFYDCIEELRLQGNIILHNDFIEPNEDELEFVTEFLKSEFQKELIALPDNTPEFCEAAAIWGAKTTFIAAQLLLIRNLEDKSFDEIFPKFKEELTAANVLSADLCLRFLPSILNQASNMDPYDELVKWLDKLLQEWHYSAIGWRYLDADVHLVDVNLVEQPFMRLLYVERILNRKAQHRLPTEIKELLEPIINYK